MAAFGFPYGNDTMEVWSADDEGMLWYELSQDKKKRETRVRQAEEVQARAAQQLEAQPIPNPSPGSAPTSPQQDTHTGSSGGGLLAGIGGGLLIIGGVVLIGGTIAEDVVTGGIGILDDPLTIGGGAAGIGEGWGLLASEFALAA